MSERAKQERRSHPRIAAAIATVIYVDGGTRVARANNVSLGGMGLTLGEALPDNTPVELSFHLVRQGEVDATTPRLLIAGQVMWAVEAEGGFDVGIRFTGLDGEQRGLLQGFIERLSDQQTPPPPPET